MKNVSKNANSIFLLNKNFIGLLIGLVVVSGIAYGVLRDQFASEENSPPNLSTETSMLQGLIKTGIYLKFDDSDFERTALLPVPTERNRGLSYFYAERDMTMLEIANSIKPDKDLRVVIAHFGENLSKTGNEDARMFYSFPHGVYGNTKAIDEDNDFSYVVKAYDGIIIAASKDYASWNLKEVDEMPLHSFDNMNELHRGWNLLATNNVESTVRSCRNRISSIYKYKKSTSLDFVKIDVDEPEFDAGKYMGWFYLTGDQDSCVDLRVPGDDVVCENKELRESSKYICLNNNWVPCDQSSLGSSIFSAEFVCDGTAWGETSENEITVNTVMPSVDAAYEDDSQVIVFFNENNVIPGEKFEEISIKKIAGAKNADKAKIRFFSEDVGFVKLTYSLLEPITEYKISFPIGSLKRGNVSNSSEITANFSTSITSTPPEVSTLNCVNHDDNTVVLNGETISRDCNTCTCIKGSLRCTLMSCGEGNAPECFVTGVLNRDNKLCVGGRLISCNNEALSLDFQDYTWSLVNGVFSTTTGGAYQCDAAEGSWEIPTSRDLFNDYFGRKDVLVGGEEAFTWEYELSLNPTNNAVLEDDQLVVMIKAPVNSYSDFILDENLIKDVKIESLNTDGSYVDKILKIDCNGDSVEKPVRFIPSAIPYSDSAKTATHWLIVKFKNQSGLKYKVTIPAGLLKYKDSLSPAISTEFSSDYLNFIKVLSEKVLPGQDANSNCKVNSGATSIVNLSCIKSFFGEQLTDKQSEILDVLIAAYKNPATSAVVSEDELNSLKCLGFDDFVLCSNCLNKANLAENEEISGSNVERVFQFKTPTQTLDLVQNVSTGAISRKEDILKPTDYEKSVLSVLKNAKEINPAIREDLLRKLMDQPNISEVDLAKFDLELKVLESMSPEAQVKQLETIQSLEF